MENLISVKNLYLGYDNADVIKNLSFEFYDGEFLCIVGANGAGKSTLIKGILGFIKPSKGKITFNNLKQSNIGYIPQDTSVNKMFPASVLEIVMSGTLNRNGFGSFYSSEQKEIAVNSLKRLKIERLKDKSFSDLSGGERQKVLIARALSATTKLLILDEPSNNLDQKSRLELYDILRDINEKDKISIMMITHDLDHKNLVGNNILSINEGQYFYGSTEEYVKEIHHE